MNPQYTTAVFENQAIYFTEPYAAQLKPEGLAIGSSRAEANPGQLTTFNQMAGTERNTKGTNTANLLQWVYWNLGHTGSYTDMGIGSMGRQRIV